MFLFSVKVEVTGCLLRMFQISQFRYMGFMNKCKNEKNSRVSIMAVMQCGKK